MKCTACQTDLEGKEHVEVDYIFGRAALCLRCGEEAQNGLIYLQQWLRQLTRGRYRRVSASGAHDGK